MTGVFSGNNNATRVDGKRYLDAGGAAFAHGVGHGGARRIDHGDEAQEAEPLGGEVRVVAVEGEPSGEMGRRQTGVAEPCERRGTDTSARPAATQRRCHNRRGALNRRNSLQGCMCVFIRYSHSHSETLSDRLHTDPCGFHSRSIAQIESATF